MHCLRTMTLWEVVGLRKTEPGALFPWPPSQVPGPIDQPLRLVSKPGFWTRFWARASSTPTRRRSDDSIPPTRVTVQPPVLISALILGSPFLAPGISYHSLRTESRHLFRL